MTSTLVYKVYTPVGQKLNVKFYVVSNLYPKFIEEPVPSHECERSCICVLRSCICVLVVSILSLFLRFFYWGLDLFRRCDISFYMILY
jgi:hypothetical protein